MESERCYERNNKTALGAQDTVAWEYHADPREALKSMKHNGVRICGLEIAEGSHPCADLTPSDFPICLIVGNEVDGLEEELLQLCDEVLEIPQYGTKHSLNVAVAAGIVLFELVQIYRRAM